MPEDHYKYVFWAYYTLKKITLKLLSNSLSILTGVLRLLLKYISPSNNFLKLLMLQKYYHYDQADLGATGITGLTY